MDQKIKQSLLLTKDLNQKKKKGLAPNRLNEDTFNEHFFTISSILPYHQQHHL